jgi:iron complex outermembrane receptor protein
MKLINKLTVLSLTMAMVSFALPSHLYAQDGTLAIEEITVTARKKEESLADAPYTITALTSQQIELAGIKQLSDVVAYTPGFFYSDNNVGKNSRSHKRLIFRGMNPRTDIPTRQASTMFIDGAASVGAEFGGIENVERIEVLKGPQGAHFGRSTYTGAINIVTKDPGDEFSGAINFEAGKYGTQRAGIILDGPLGESLGYRLTTSTYDMDGMYDNANVEGQKLGAQSTDDVSLTLVFEPSDRFKIKARYHTWEDSDGPDAGTAYDYRSGHYNCSPGGLVERWDPVMTQAAAAYVFNPATNVAVTTICGKVAVPTASEIGQDTGSARALQLLGLRIDEHLFPIANGIRDVPDFMVPDHFGMEREAEELSIVVDVNFDNGMNLNIVSAEHENAYSSHNDVDRRVTEGLYLEGKGGGMFGGFGANHPADASDLRMNSMQDSSIEVRLSSSQDQRVRWMFGYSDVDMDWFTQNIGSMIVYYPDDGIDNGERVAAGQMPVSYNPYWPFYGNGLAGSGAGTSNAGGAYGDVTSNNNDFKWDTVNTSSFYASLEADFTDKLTVSLDLRQQEDDVTSGGIGAYAGGAVGPLANVQQGVFKSTLPRVILDYKPNDDRTIYFSYSEGTLPGLFNPALAALSASQLDQVKAQTGGAGVEIDEETSENIEFGIKSSIMDGRGFIAVAFYQTDLTNVHTPLFAVSYTGDDGTQQVISGNTTSQGGKAELSGIELDGTILLNDLWSLDFTYAKNDSEIKSGFQSADTFDLMGDRNAAIGNEFSRYPKNSGSLSANYAKEIDAERTRFARIDYLYTGSMYASNAMLAYTGSGAKINLRVGQETDKYRIEAYCTNCFNDNQPKGLQQMYDLSGITGGFGDGAVTAAGPRILSVALADKRVIGVRASYKF